MISEKMGQIQRIMKLKTFLLLKDLPPDMTSSSIM